MKKKKKMGEKCDCEKETKRCNCDCEKEKKCEKNVHTFQTLVYVWFLRKYEKKIYFPSQ